MKNWKHSFFFARFSFQIFRFIFLFLYLYILLSPIFYLSIFISTHMKSRFDIFSFQIWKSSRLYHHVRTSSNLQVFYLQIFSCLGSIFAHASSFLVTSLDYIKKNDFPKEYIANLVAGDEDRSSNQRKKYCFQKSLGAIWKLNSIFKNCCVLLPPICMKWGSIFKVLVKQWFSFVD